MTKTTNKKIKITCLIKNLELGGAEKDIVNLLSACDSKKFKIKFLIVKKESSDTDFPFRYEILNLPSPKFSFFKIVKHLKKEKPDIFITLLYSTVFYLLLAKIFLRSKTKFCAFILSDLPNYLFQTRKFFYTKLVLFPLLKLSLKRLDLVFTNSQTAKKSFIKTLKIPDHKIKVIYSAIIGEEFFLKLKEEPQEEIFKNSLPKIIYIGRLAREKGLNLLIKALPFILQKQKVQLIIIGKGPKQNKIQKLAKEKGVQKNVYLLGFKNNPYKYLKKSNVLVLPSKTESFPRVIVEALVCGIPVVTTFANEDIKDIIVNGKTGFIIEKREPAILASKIEEVIKNHQEFVQEIEKIDYKLKKFYIQNSAKLFEKYLLETINC